MNNHNFLEFYKICGLLKTTKRTGWVNNGIHLPESISDHMYRMSMFAMSLGDNTLGTDGKPIDRMKCMKMALVHDLGESLVGDFTPHDKITKEEKFNLEQNAMLKIKSTLNNDAGEEIYKLWLEYEEATTCEALLVKDFDKFEMILQALEYEKSQGKDLQSFFDSTRNRFKHPIFQDLAIKVEQERPKNNK
ncbi:HD domain-containing protein 2 [Heterostelium album PN500]|uniref:5'-deoxynucleotidase n=1 Tax=Heterostelium pallidum (strain ATCC 26659 / Pp 5 / PN500) TaxID=670386 RepID=D3B6T6_HETP5|nr:HD domain-containing protein 2 [Heterostelium album PN500]EFA83056.1 HD domain-containing protein 2 [Heterostelium album PN500]|eukprot:XP_020435173.1 HD domain-containing protein 2 [Heterostelium album PN500]